MHSKVDILSLHLVHLVYPIGKSATFLRVRHSLQVGLLLCFEGKLSGHSKHALAECAWLCGQIERESSSGSGSMP